MRWLEACCALMLALGLGAGAASAEEARRIDVEVLVAHISDAPGGVDPRAGKLHRKLQNEFRYESLRVLQSRTLGLALDDVGSVELPNGKSLRVRPLQVDEKGALLAVSVQGTLQTDLRVRNGHLVVIGAERFEEGKLVISLEPTW